MARSPRIRIDAASGIPAVRQIADSLRILFVESQFAAGSTLPSVRRVAMELGVHFNTVAEAYRQLADEGWLNLRHGRSAVVMPRAVPAAENGAWAEQFRIRLRGMAAQMRADGISPDRIAAELRAMAKVVTRS